MGLFGNKKLSQAEVSQFKDAKTLMDAGHGFGFRCEILDKSPHGYNVQFTGFVPNLDVSGEWGGDEPLKKMKENSKTGLFFAEMYAQESDIPTQTLDFPVSKMVFDEWMKRYKKRYPDAYKSIVNAAKDRFTELQAQKVTDQMLRKPVVCSVGDFRAFKSPIEDAIRILNQTQVTVTPDKDLGYKVHAEETIDGKKKGSDFSVSRMRTFFGSVYTLTINGELVCDGMRYAPRHNMEMLYAEVKKKSKQPQPTKDLVIHFR